jgi:glutathione S-transferase
MKLYEFAPTRSIRARWTLQELGIPFDAEVVNLMAGEHRSPEFLALNPAGKLPVLVDGDLVLNESVAIVLYLADKYPEKRLLPADPVQRAEAQKWLLFAATELEQPLWRMARHSMLYPEEKRLPADIDLAREDFAPMVQILEAHMKGREYVVGDHVGVVDFVMAYTLDWAEMVGLLDDCPTLRAYMERMYRRPQAPLRIADAFACVRAAQAAG